MVYTRLKHFVGNLNTGVLRGWLPLIMSCLLATSCSTVLFGYDAVPSLIKYQLNRYFDLTTEQQELAERHLDDIFVWHRQTQLKNYALFLNQVADKAVNSANRAINPTEVASWRTTIEAAWTPVADRVAGPFTELMLSLKPAQIEHLKKRWAATNKDMREDYVKASAKSAPIARQKARADRVKKRAEFFLDDLTSDQDAMLTKRAREVPDSEEAWYGERLARQEAFLLLLDKIRTQKLNRSQAEPLMAAYLQTMWQPKDSARGKQIAESTRASDETTALVLESASAAQRAYMVSKIRGYASDFEKLKNRGSTGQ